MNVSSGVAPFDERLGGLRAGGLYLLAGAPGTGKMPLLLQFLSAGLATDDSLALLSGHSPDEVFEQARYWGLHGLEEAWRGSRFTILGFRGEYPRRILHAADPQEALNELTEYLPSRVGRVAVDPGTMLWETRAGMAMANAFLAWHERLGATVVATAVADLDENLPQSTDWIVQRAEGVFRLARLTSGLRELTIHRMRTPAEDFGPITLELRPGVGLAVPTTRPGRRSTDAPADGDRRLALLRLGSNGVDDAETWLRDVYDVSDANDPLELVSLLQAEPVSVVAIALTRSDVAEAIRVCRTVREMTRGAIVLLSSDRLRSTDRARALEAGADDVLQQDAAIPEIKLRLSKAKSYQRNGVGFAASSNGIHPIPELLEADRFAVEVADRLDSADEAYLTLLLLPESVDARIIELLREHLRTETGDFAGHAGDGYGFVLQDARARHAKAFLDRATSSLKRTERNLNVRILTSPEEVEDIRAAVGD